MKNLIIRNLYLIKKQILLLILIYIPIFIRLFYSNDLDVFYYYKIIFFI